MTEDYRAAPELWAAAEKWGADSMDMANCILELRSRIELLEVQQQIRSGPESPLVERVADAIAAQATSAGIVNDRPARAAILEVAAWLTENYASDVDGPPPHQMLHWRPSMTDLNPVDAMTTDYRALCAELVDKLHEHTSMWKGHEIDLVIRARALLDQPVAEAPTDEELWAAGSDDFRANYYPTDAIAYARAVLARWGRPTPQPNAQ